MIRNVLIASVALLGITISGCGVEPTDATPVETTQQALVGNAELDGQVAAEKEMVAATDEDPETEVCTTACWTKCSSNGRGWTRVYRVTDGSRGNCVGRAYAFCNRLSSTYDHACMHWGCSSFSCP